MPGGVVEQKQSLECAWILIVVMFSFTIKMSRRWPCSELIITITTKLVFRMLVGKWKYTRVQLHLLL